MTRLIEVGGCLNSTIQTSVQALAVGKDRAELVIRQELIDLSIESCEVLVRHADLQEIARRGRASLPRRR
jgi:hypothetical protein